MSAYIELIFPVTLLAAATSDIVRYEIPNGLPIALLVGFLAYALASDRSVIDIGASLACGFLVLAVGATLFRLNWLGGGDVKLLAAATPWVGWAELPAFMIWVAIWGLSLIHI